MGECMEYSLGTLCTFILSYLLGAIPTGFLVARRCGIADIRQHGSGNIGATNVARVLGTRFFCLILFLDAGKAFFNIKLLHYFSHDSMTIYIAAIVHLIANGYSPFLNWTGGKGGAALFGLLCAFKTYVVLLYAALIWISVCITTYIVGLASILAALSLPLIAWYTQYSYDLLFFFVFAAIWVVVRHRKNLMFLFAHI